MDRSQITDNLKSILKYGVGIFVIVGLVYLSSKHSPLSEKEIQFNKNALVVTDEQDWHQIGGDILKLFDVSGNQDEWTCFQYFGGEDGSDDLVDSENYKKWRQGIFKISNKKIILWREEEWAFMDSTKQWTLVKRSFWKTEK